LALHPMGFSVPRRLRFARWSLTPPFHPYRQTCVHRRSDFLWHFPSKSLPTFRPRISPAKPELRGITPYGVRTFLFRLAPKAILRPSKTSLRITEPAEFFKSQTFKNNARNYELVTPATGFCGRTFFGSGGNGRYRSSVLSNFCAPSLLESKPF
jgi:hypothetical protein